MEGGNFRSTFAVICLAHIFSHLTAVAGEESCSQSAKMDLQIIVDSSASVGLEQFRSMMKQISQSLIGNLDIGADKTRVALFKYSSENIMRNEFSLNKFTSLSELQAQVEATTYEMGMTYTAMAMNKALELYKQDQRDAKETARVCVLFTDGWATDYKGVPAAGKAWAADGVTVVAVGVTDGIDKQGLIDIAGAEERALQVKSFDEIATLATSLLKKVCKAVLEKKPSVIKVNADNTRVASVCTSWLGKKELSMECPTGNNIEVIKAFYGFWNEDEKCHFQEGECTESTYNPACSGNSCKVMADASTLSLACGKIHDYMQVEYKCVPV